MTLFFKLSNSIGPDMLEQKSIFLTEEEQSLMRSELGKLMWLARIARPGAIYDASAAARSFANSKPENCDEATAFDKNK